MRIGGWRELSARVFAEAEGRAVLAEGYAATSLLSFYGPAGARVAELGEPERWSFRPRVEIDGEALAFGRADFIDTLRRRFADVTPLRTFRRRVGAVELEPYALFALPAAAWRR